MPRPMTQDEHKKGYIICDCGKFAHIWNSNVLPLLPKNYNGELCPECNLWMCLVTYLELVIKNQGD